MFPILYQNAFFTLTTFGVFGVAAFFCAAFLLVRLVPKRKLDLQFVVDSFWYIVVGGLILGRIESVLSSWYLFADNWLLIFYGFWVEGIGFWGALGGGLLGLAVQCWRKKECFLPWLDLFILCVLPSLGLGFVGQFFDGTNYGTPTELPWGVTFDSATVPYTIPVHPVQIYLSLAALLSATVAFLLFRRKANSGVAGLVGGVIFVVLYFFLGFTFGNTDYFLGGVSLSQWLGMVFALELLAVFFFFKFLKQK